MEKAGKYLQKVFELLLFFTVIFCGVVIFDKASDPFWIVEKFFFKFAVSILVVVFSALCFTRKEFPVFKTPYDIPFAVFMAASLLGLVGIPNIYAFIDRFFLNLCFFIFYYMVNYFTAAAPAVNSRKLLAAVLAGGLIISIYGLLQASGADFMPWNNTFSGRAASTLGNPDFLAGHILLLIPLALSFFVGTEKKTNRVIFFILSAVFTGVLIATQTRGAYLGMAASLAVLTALLMAYEKAVFKRYRNVAIAAGLVLIIGMGVYFAANPQAARRTGDIFSSKDEAWHQRSSMWKNSMYMIKDHFFTGSGAGNYYIAYSFYQSKAMAPADYAVSDYIKTGHTHNDFIQFLAEYGIFGAGAMYAFLALIILTAIKYLRKQEAGGKIAVIGIVSGVSGILVHALFNFPFQIVPTMAVFFACVAAAVSLQGQVRIREGSGAIKYVYGAALVFFLVAAGFAARILAADVYLRSAKASEHFNRTYDRVNYASEAAELNPWDDETNYYYGTALEANNNPEKAFQVYREVYKLNPGHWENLNRLFDLYAEKGDKEAMLNVSEKMYRVSPYALKAVSARAYAFYSNAKFDDAIAIYEKGLSDRGESPDLYSQLAAAYGAKGNVQKTLEYTEKAIALNPAYTDAYYNLAVAYYRMGNRAGAVEALEKILKIDPSDAKAKGFIKVIQDAGKK
jgi:O-antigen ligase/tetratricopeptide (TPR) repeat protein